MTEQQARSVCLALISINIGVWFLVGMGLAR
jgi:hypothetical protein